MNSGGKACSDSICFILICLAGRLNKNQQEVIEYLREEVRVLREQHGPKRLRFTDEQRRRLGRKAERIKIGKLKEMAAIVTPQTLLAWQRRLIAKKDDSSAKRMGRPRIKVPLSDLVIQLAKENRR